MSESVIVTKYKPLIAETLLNELVEKHKLKATKVQVIAVM